MKELLIGVTLGICFTLLSFLFFVEPCKAANTMDLEDSYREGNGKVCVYSDGRHTATVYKPGAGSCPSKHTS